MNASLNSSNITEPYTFCIRGINMSPESYFSAMYNFAVVSIIVDIPLALMAVLGNGLIFVAYYQNESLRSPANTILVSLAFTDFLTGAVSQPLYIYDRFLILANSTEELCSLYMPRVFSAIFLFGATLLNLSVTTLDRYVAILHSFRYRELVTRERVIRVLVILWLAWISISIAGMILSIQVVLKIWMVVALSNIIFICVLNYKIFRELRRLQGNQVIALNEVEEARKAGERKTAKTVGIILGLLFCCYVPLTLCFVYNFTTKIDSQVLYQQVLYASVSIASSNSSLNVFVYFWKNTEMRSAILKVFRKINQRFKNEVQP